MSVTDAATISFKYSRYNPLRKYQEFMWSNWGKLNHLIINEGSSKVPYSLDQYSLI